MDTAPVLQRAFERQASVDLVANTGAPQTSLLVAAAQGAVPLVAALLDHSANVQAAAWISDAAQTPLDVAGVEVAQLLRRHGARHAVELLRREAQPQPSDDDDSGAGPGRFACNLTDGCGVATRTASQPLNPDRATPLTLT